MKSLIQILMTFAAISMLLTGAALATGGQENEKPDHCSIAGEKMKEAANEFGHGNIGNAAEKIGEAAGAAVECIREKVAAGSANTSALSESKSSSEPKPSSSNNKKDGP